MLKASYNTKKVLVTGHTGFKGYWLCNILNYLGARVYGISDRFIFSENQQLIEKVVEKSYFCDIREHDVLDAIISEIEPDYIFHFAAQSLVRQSYVRPDETWTVNLNGTLNVLNAASSLKKPLNLICATTDKVYKNDSNILKKFTENDPLGGDDPYSASKAACELLINSYNFKLSANNNEFIKLKSVRAGNVIGGADWSIDRIVPDIIRSASQRFSLNIRNSSSVRPWQHVIDCCVGYLLIGLDHGSHISYNVGPSTNEEINVDDIITHAKSYFDFSHQYVCDDSKPEKKFLQLDTSLVENELQFVPKYSGLQIFDLTFDWYRVFLSDKKCIARKQIKEYFEGINHD